MSPAENLLMDISGEEYDGKRVVYYGRYWHGYQVLLKPLSCFFTLSDIRYMNMCLQFVLLVFVLKELNEKANKKLLAVFLITFLTLNPVSVIMCMQYSSVHTVMMIALYVLLKYRFYERNDACSFVFLAIGIATAYLDLLTYPLVGMAIPLLMVMTIKEYSFIEHIKCIFFNTLAWACGYVGMWMGKWIVASILTKENVLQDAWDNVLHRISNGAEDEIGIAKFSMLDVIKKNVEGFMNMPEYVFFLILLCAIVLLWLMRKISFTLNAHILCYILVGVFPLVWYCIVSNHSMVHVWLTHRNLSISLCAILSCAVKMICCGDERKL